MKKQIIFSLLFLSLGLSSATKAQISVGLRAGFLLTNVDKTPLEDGEPTPEAIGGFQAAIPIEIAIGDMFAVQPEIMFGTHGARQEVNNETTNLGVTTKSFFKSRYQVSALEIPVLAKLKLGSEYLQFQVFAGPSIGLGMTGKYKQETSFKSTLADGTVLIESASDDELSPQFLKDGYRTEDLKGDEFAVSQTNLNLHMGVGASINLGGPKLFLDVRYILGLSDFRPEAEGDSKDVSYKSNRLGVGLGLLFPL